MTPSSKCTNAKYLETLLEMCFQQFDDVVAAHSLLLKCLTKIKATYKGNNYSTRITDHHYCRDL